MGDITSRLDVTAGKRLVWMAVVAAGLVLRSPVATTLAAQAAEDAAAPVARQTADAQDKEHFRSLLVQRRNVARREFQACEAALPMSMASGYGCDALDRVASAHRRLLESELDLAETPSERIAIYRAAANAATQMEERISLRLDVAIQDKHRLEQNRIKAEIDLFQELMKLKTPGDGPVVLVERCNPREQSAIAAIEAAGGRVKVDAKRPEVPVVSVRFLPSACEPANEPQAALSSSPAPPAADARLAIVPSPVPPIVMPFRPSGKVPDSVFEQIAEFKCLQALYLRGVRVTESNLRQLAALPQLQTLVVAECGVTDSGLRHLAGLKNLRTLDVSWNPVTAKGLESLKDFPSLKQVNIAMTEAAGPGAERLQESLPDVRIQGADQPPPTRVPYPQAEPQLPMPR